MFEFLEIIICQTSLGEFDPFYMNSMYTTLESLVC